jgi:formate C-acetyltransferase
MQKDKLPKYNPYHGFKRGNWNHSIDVRDFIYRNYKLYKGTGDFLEKPTSKTRSLWEEVSRLLKKEVKRHGVLGIDATKVSSITSHKPGYIDKNNESIVGLQTEKPLIKAIKPNGGLQLIEKTLKDLGYKPDPKIHDIYTNYVTTHNDGVFNIYKNWKEFHTPEGNLLRSEGIITGLPDNYGRGRIIGDYRRVALYGVDKLISERKDDEERICGSYMDEENIRKRQFFHKQVKALEQLKEMAVSYGFDISKPATDTKEAIQWLYFGYLAAVKEQDGAAMSLGRVDSFIDIYAERDLRDKKYSEKEIQQFIDDFVIKLRIVRHLRHPEYDAVFAGDPTWVTCSIAGMGVNKEYFMKPPKSGVLRPRFKKVPLKPLVTKTSFRLLHTLQNLGPAPEPNLTVLWSKYLPENFKRFAAHISISTSSIQFENDDIMRPYHGDDYAIACCVSAMTVGKQMQLFGARANLAKLLLMVINEGRNELTGQKIVDGVPELGSKDILDYEEVISLYFGWMDWLAKMYVQTMNVIHFMHDTYHYENVEMALHDAEIHRFMAFGLAGLSVVTDSLSAIKYAKVKPIYDERGLTKDFIVEGEYPCYGNNDDRADKIAVEICNKFIEALKKYPTYKGAEHTLSILTITSNVVYGKHTGSTPDGRKSLTPFAPGANPMHGRDRLGALASLNSVAKIPYSSCRDGISNTFSITPNTLGKNHEMRTKNLCTLLDGYFSKKAHHLNVNVMNRDMLVDSMQNPWKYPQLTIRVSGYAVHFIRLTKEQQLEVINRTFHEAIN